MIFGLVVYSVVLVFLLLIGTYNKAKVLEAEYATANNGFKELYVEIKSVYEMD